MALSMEQLKAAFKKRTDQTQNNGFWEKFYPFYKMNFNEVATFRFVPDLDENNPWAFVVENKYHELTVNGKKKSVACLEMYGEDCPLCEASRSFYNEGDKTMGKIFWRKIDYIASGIVISSPFENPAPDANPVRLVKLGSKLFEIIEHALVSGDFDEPPYDLVNGCDFRISKTQQGEYASYTTSTFARKQTPVPEALLEKLELIDLKSYRYAKIEKEQLEAIRESVITGRSFEESSAPAGDAPPVQKEARPLSEAPAPVAAPAAPQAAAPAPAPAADASNGSSRAQEILARLRRSQAPQ